MLSINLSIATLLPIGHQTIVAPQQANPSTTSSEENNKATEDVTVAPDVESTNGSETDHESDSDLSSEVNSDNNNDNNDDDGDNDDGSDNGGQYYDIEYFGTGTGTDQPEGDDIEGGDIEGGDIEYFDVDVDHLEDNYDNDEGGEVIGEAGSLRVFFEAILFPSVGAFFGGFA